MEVVPGLSATYRIRVQGVPQLVKQQGHNKPSGKSSALAQLERWLTQLGKSGYGDYMSSHAFSTK